MSERVVVVGGGHNGMICALLLAQGGRAVTLVEARAQLGGLCRGDVFHEGFTSPGALHDDGLVPVALTDALGLDLPRARRPDFAPGLDTAALKGADAEAFAEHEAFLHRISDLVGGALSRTPPPLSPATLGELLTLGGQGLKLRRLGSKDMVELIRVLPMAAGDYVKERFEDERLRALVAGPGCIGTFLGPWSAGSAAAMLLRAAARGDGIVGGGRALVQALEAKLEAVDVDVRTSAEVTRVCVTDGAVDGVELASGERVDAEAVVLTCDPKRGLLDLLDPFDLPLKVREALRKVRARGTTSKIDLALTADLAFDEGARRVFVARELDDVERAFDAVKYQRLPARPYLDVYLASREDRGLAPDGQHTVSILASFTPYDLEGGWNDDARAALLDRVLTVLDEAAPGARDLVIASRVLGPPDLESEYGVTGGCLHHVEHSLDQLLFMRPTTALAHYRAPVEGLFLGGAGSHPGGGVRGQSGALAARAILKG